MKSFKKYSNFEEAVLKFTSSLSKNCEENIHQTLTKLLQDFIADVSDLSLTKEELSAFETIVSNFISQCYTQYGMLITSPIFDKITEHNSAERNQSLINILVKSSAHNLHEVVNDDLKWISKEQWETNLSPLTSVLQRISEESRKGLTVVLKQVRNTHFGNSQQATSVAYMLLALNSNTAKSLGTEIITKWKLPEPTPSTTLKRLAQINISLPTDGRNGTKRNNSPKSSLEAH